MKFQTHAETHLVIKMCFIKIKTTIKMLKTYNNIKTDFSYCRTDTVFCFQH